MYAFGFGAVMMFLGLPYFLGVSLDCHINPIE
jgi:hypothetical protein